MFKNVNLYSTVRKNIFEKVSDTLLYRPMFVCVYIHNVYICVCMDAKIVI